MIVSDRIGFDRWDAQWMDGWDALYGGVLLLFFFISNPFLLEDDMIVMDGCFLLRLHGLPGVCV